MLISITFPFYLMIDSNKMAVLFYKLQITLHKSF